MKFLISILLLFTTLHCFGQTEEILTDLNNDYKIDTIIFNSKTCKSIRISLSGFDTKTFINKDD